MAPVKNRRPSSEPVRVIGYVRVSTLEQAENGAGLTAQRSAIENAAAQRSWQLVRIYEDSASGKTINGRTGLAAAIAAIENGDADGLVVGKLDRLSRSLLDFAALMDRSRKRGWALVALDLGLDTTTPSGEMMANILATFAQFERRMIGQRTREGLAVKRSQGVRLGRESTLDPDTRARILTEHREGGGYSAIARRLTEENVPTSHGGARWYASTVRGIVLGEPQREGASA